MERTALDRLQEARRRFEHRIADLDTIANWKRDLEQRIAREQLRFNYCDALSGKYDELLAELEDFRVVCFALAGAKGEA